MTYNFWWMAPSGGLPIVSLAKYGITFSMGAIDMLGKPEAVLIGFDEKERTIGVKPLHGSEVKQPKAFRFANRLRQGYIRIGCRDFVKVLSSRTGKDFSTTTRYAAKMDDSQGILLVDLDEPLDPDQDDEQE